MDLGSGYLNLRTEGGMVLEKLLSGKGFRVALLISILSAAPAAADQVVTVSGTGSALGSIHLLSVPFMKANPRVRIEVLPVLGTTGSVKAVLAGKLDIGVGGGR